MTPDETAAAEAARVAYDAMTPEERARHRATQCECRELLRQLAVEHDARKERP